MKQLAVVAAVIICDNDILCMQRGKEKYDYVSYRFEFPGGKIELGETSVEALKRELWEELGLVINVLEKDFFMEVRHEYPDFAIHLDSFICSVMTKRFELKEHQSYQWCKLQELSKLDWLPADRLIVERLEVCCKC